MPSPAAKGRAPATIWIAALVLVTAVLLPAAHIFREEAAPRPAHLAATVPSDIAGWTERDLPLGPSEFLSTEAQKVLNCDEFVNREFRRGGTTFGVYVAYWSAGKMPTRLVASHTPDRCWTENGWRCLEMRFKQPVALDGVPLPDAEWRLFEPPQGGAPVYVLYWHLVEGRLYDYGSRFNNVPDPVRWWKDAVQQAMLGSREQYFIRLTSTEPLENLWNDPGVIEVLHSLRQLGLTMRVPPPAKS